MKAELLIKKSQMIKLMVIYKIPYRKENNNLS
jgi:hypothetical protein